MGMQTLATTGIEYNEDEYMDPVEAAEAAAIDGADDDDMSVASVATTTEPDQYGRVGTKIPNPASIPPASHEDLQMYPVTGGPILLGQRWYDPLLPELMDTTGFESSNDRSD